MTSTKYIGMDVHKESISIAVMNSVGKVVMECVIETKASTIVQFIDGLRGDLQVTFEEGTWAASFIGLFRCADNSGLVAGSQLESFRAFAKSCPSHCSCCSLSPKKDSAASRKGILINP